MYVENFSVMGWPSSSVVGPARIHTCTVCTRRASKPNTRLDQTDFQKKGLFMYMCNALLYLAEQRPLSKMNSGSALGLHDWWKTLWTDKLQA